LLETGRGVAGVFDIQPMIIHSVRCDCMHFADRIAEMVQICSPFAGKERRLCGSNPCPAAELPRPAARRNGTKVPILPWF